jgi:small-conductance mechanosensitive channel
MRHLQDLNFGITRWFLRPPFLVKIGSALISFILLIYIFVATSRFADSIWKDAIGRGHVILCALMALAMICQCLALLFYFYKTFSQASSLFFFASLAFGALYLLLVIIFCAGFVSASKSESYTETITNFLFNHTDAASAQTFIRQYSVDLQNKDGVAAIVRRYVDKRTVSVKTGISIVSMFWLVIIALLYFIVLFEAKPDAAGNEHIHSMRSEIEA